MNTTTATAPKAQDPIQRVTKANALEARGLTYEKALELVDRAAAARRPR
jgi:hypothetical protein